MKVHRKVHLYFVDSSFLYWSCLQVEAGGWTTGQRTEDTTYTVDKQMNTSYTAEEAFYLCNHVIGIWKSIGGIWLAFYDHIMLWKNMVGLKKIEAKWQGHVIFLDRNAAYRAFELLSLHIWIILLHFGLWFFSFCHGTFYCRCMNMFHGRDIVVLIMSWRMLINLLSISLLFSFVIVV